MKSIVFFLLCWWITNFWCAITIVVLAWLLLDE